MLGSVSGKGMPTDKDGESSESDEFALPSRPYGRSAADEPPNVTVTNAVAEALETDPLELPPLNDAIDPEALDTLVRSCRWREGDWPAITFPYADCLVVVTGPDEIEVVREDRAGPEIRMGERDWPHVSAHGSESRSESGPRLGLDLDEWHTEPLEARILRAVAERSTADRSRVRDAVDEVVDRTALAELNRPRANGVPRFGAAVRFSVLGYDVVVDPDGTVAIGSTLERLKLTGSNVLLVGAVPDAISDRASARLLGRHDGHRRRILALVDRGVRTALDRLSLAGRSAEPARVIEYGSPARSAAAESIADDPASESGPGFDLEPEPPVDTPTAFDADRVPEPRVETVDGDVDAFLEALDAALEDEGDDPGGDLRLCVDSLRPLLEEHGTERTKSLLEPICRRVNDRSGIGHYVLPVERESESVRAIESLFDATIELRIDGTEPIQRWHLHASDYVTDWFGL